MMNSKLTLLTAFLIVTLAACSSNNSDDPLEGNFTVTIENVGTAYSYIKSGSFSIPVGGTAPGAIGPGGAYEFEFTAPLGSRLSLATMFVQSNDWFYAPGQNGLALYNQDGSQVTGDVTSFFNLYDAGTEADEEPGVGANQAPRQSGANTGAADSDNTVRSVNTANLPADEEVIQVTLTSTGPTGFRVRIENVSSASTLSTSNGSVAVPLAPGNWVVHAESETAVLFEVGQPDYGNGLEGVAEDGTFGTLEASLESETGLTVPLSPGVFAVYTESNPLFIAGQADAENGLEGLAEDGTVGELSAALEATSNVRASGSFAQPVGASENGPLLPGNSYSFSFSAQEGDLLNLATMFVQSNDLFYALGSSGISLFENGAPISGDISSSINLWDAGTELNQEPGIGMYQVIRQGGSDIGPVDSDMTIRLVNDNYTYPMVNDVIRITISLNQ